MYIDKSTNYFINGKQFCPGKTEKSFSHKLPGYFIQGPGVIKSCPAGTKTIYINSPELHSGFGMQKLVSSVQSAVLIWSLVKLSLEQLTHLS
jgi:hypothetical protein